MSQNRIAAVVVNEHGVVLPYTMQGTREQCEERMVDELGAAWEKLKSQGARVSTCEIVLLD